MPAGIKNNKKDGLSESKSSVSPLTSIVVFHRGQRLDMTAERTWGLRLDGWPILSTEKTWALEKIRSDEMMIISVPERCRSV